jgi:hypothetical protein
MGKPKGDIPLGRLGRKREDDIKRVIKTVCESVDCISLAQDTFQ